MARVVLTVLTFSFCINIFVPRIFLPALELAWAGKGQRPGSHRDRRSGQTDLSEKGEEGKRGRGDLSDDGRNIRGKKIKNLSPASQLVGLLDAKGSPRVW